jgi:hypothetical protein
VARLLSRAGQHDLELLDRKHGPEAILILRRLRMTEADPVRL